MATVGDLLAQYKYAAKRKKIPWNLAREDFERLTKENCVYCNKPPSRVRRGYRFTGVDRKDNDRGYELENCVPCCSECNYIKGGYLTHDEMHAAMAAVLAYRKIKFFSEGCGS